MNVKSANCKTKKCSSQSTDFKWCQSLLRFVYPPLGTSAQRPPPSKHRLARRYTPCTFFYEKIKGCTYYKYSAKSTFRMKGIHVIPRRMIRRNMIEGRQKSLVGLQFLTIYQCRGNHYNLLTNTCITMVFSSYGFGTSAK